MTSVSALVQMMKEGLITKDEMIDRISENEIRPIQVQEKIRASPITPQRELQFPSEYTSQTRTIDYMFPPEFYTETTESSKVSDVSTSSQQFFRRQENFQCRKKQNSHNMAKQKERSELQGCTFTPKTKKYAKTPSEPVFQRLWRPRKKTQIESYEQKRKKAEEEEIKEHCTFEPQTNKYKPSSPFNSHMISRQTLLHEIEKLQTCPFTPQLSTNKSFVSKNIREWTSQDVYQRLYNDSQEKNFEDSSLGSSQSFSPSKERYWKSISEKFEDSFASKSFFERQALYEIHKEEKRYIAAASAEYPHQPLISEKSRNMVKNHLTFQDRNQELLNKKSAAEAKWGSTDYSFKPEISQFAQTQPQRTPDDMVYGDVDRKQLEKLVLQRKHALNVQTEEHSFAPTLKKTAYDNVPSVLALKRSPNDILSRTKERSQQRQKKLEKQADYYQEQQLSECTHHPRIRKSPAFIRKIARSMAKLKLEETMPVPSRPDWK